MILGVTYKQLAVIAAVSAMVVYASNNRLPLLNNSVRTVIGG